MKFFFAVLFVFCLSGNVLAQHDTIPKTAFTKMFLPIWQEAKAHCMAVAEAMPEELYAYKPTEVSKTFGEQMIHIAASTELLAKRYVLGKEVKPNTPDAWKMSKSEIMDSLEKAFDYMTYVVQTVEQSKLDETCVMYHSGNTVSRAFALFYVHDHMANHRAKSNLYLRLNRIEPPAYTW